MNGRSAGQRTMVLALAVGWSGFVQAQTLQELPFRDRGRDPSLSVADRRHPELDPSGLRVGGFVLVPSIDGGVQYDSNIYALERNVVSDTVATIGASLTARSDWSRNAVSAGASVGRRQYLKADDESTTDWRLNGAGRLDLGGATFDLTAEQARQTQARSDVDAPGTADRPIRYDRTGGSLVAERAFGRLTARAGADWHRFRFDDARSVDGTILPQDYRNRTIVTGLGRVDLGVSPALALYVDGTVNRRSYGARSAAALDRDSWGYTIEAGTDFDISRLVRGHVQGGYLSQRGSGNRWKANGVSGRGRIEWFVRPVLTFTVEGGRRIEDSAETDTPAYLRTDVVARIDYELLRSVVVTARGGYSWDRFQGVDRRARRTEFAFGATYRRGRRSVFDLGYQRLTQRAPSSGDLRRFCDNRLMLSVRVSR